MSTFTVTHASYDNKATDSIFVFVFSGLFAEWCTYQHLRGELPREDHNSRGTYHLHL